MLYGLFSPARLIVVVLVVGETANITAIGAYDADFVAAHLAGVHDPSRWMSYIYGDFGHHIDCGFTGGWFRKIKKDPPAWRQGQVLSISVQSGRMG